MYEGKKIILVDKPSGITSFDVIRRLRKKLGIRKMGHAGTLDPLASGLMIIGINEGTKELSGYIGLPKVYRAEIRFGIRTTTGDVTGEIVEEEPYMVDEHVSEILQGMVGVLELPVPVFSAVKRGGEALYKKARRGEAVEAPIKKMEVFWIKNIELLSDGVQCDIHVASGTYIRSIAEELGRRLYTCATLRELRRLSIGEHRVEDSDVVV